MSSIVSMRLFPLGAGRKPWVYRPQSVRIPEDAGVKRSLAVNQTTGARAGQPLDALARSQYDADTLFYDMFFSSGALICIGPPFLNLGPPKAILCDGETLRFKMKEGSHLARHVRLRIEIPAQKQDRERLDLLFCFSDFTVLASCDMQRARPLPLEHRQMCLVTVQKENPAQWIRDWYAWHYRAHWIRRVIIYDNGSRDFPELGGAFFGMGHDLDVGLVHWPFPYGPPNSDFNKFAQAGALNHFHLFFGGCFDWGVNLDIDEYLFVERGPRLAERLWEGKRWGRAVMYLGARHFPREPVREGRLPRFFHYRMRYREKHRKPFSWPKYIFQPEYAQFCGVHYVWFSGSGGLLHIIKRLLIVLKRLLLTLFKKKKRGLRWCLEPFLKTWFHTQFRLCIEKDCFFLHYRGLNTGWKEPGEKPGPYPGMGPEVSEIPSKFLIEDRRAAELADELGFDVAKEESGDASESPSAGPTGPIQDA